MAVLSAERRFHRSIMADRLRVVNRVARGKEKMPGAGVLVNRQFLSSVIDAKC
jgi:hypothetical protein